MSSYKNKLAYTTGKLLKLLINQINVSWLTKSILNSLFSSVGISSLKPLFALSNVSQLQPRTKTWMPPRCLWGVLAVKGRKGRDSRIRHWLAPLLVWSTFLDSVKRNRSLDFTLSSQKPERPVAETYSWGKLEILCVVPLSVRSAWERNHLTSP